MDAAFRIRKPSKRLADLLGQRGIEIENGELILIEVQINDQIDFLSRLLFGVSRAISEHIKKGDSYKQVKKVYSIAIMFFDIGHGTGCHASHFQNSVHG